MCVLHGYRLWLACKDGKFTSSGKWCGCGSKTECVDSVSLDMCNPEGVDASANSTKNIGVK